MEIATAWATEGKGLDALERLAKRRRNVEVRALVGISGGHTDPAALKRLGNLGEVRLVDDGAGLFHVKLYLFRLHRQRESFAWIGSANFTGPGFESNEELLVETECTEELREWFDGRWESVASGAEQRLQDYCRNWTKPKAPMEGVADVPSARPSSSRAAQREIRFHQLGDRPTPYINGGNGKRHSPKGQVVVAGKSFRYNSSQEAVILVLEELQRRDENFLETCWQDNRFHTGNNRCYVAEYKAKLGTPHNQMYSKRMENGWWVSKQTQTQEKWEVILAAADVAGLVVPDSQTMWEAEANPRTKVGF